MKNKIKAVIATLLLVMAAAFFLGTPRNANAYVGQYTYQFAGSFGDFGLTINGHSVTTGDLHPISPGDVITSSNMFPCNNPGSGVRIGYIQIGQIQANGSVAIIGYLQIYLGPGCESASWTIGGSGTNLTATEFNSYCPCPSQP